MSFVLISSFIKIKLLFIIVLPVNTIEYKHIKQCTDNIKVYFNFYYIACTQNNYIRRHIVAYDLLYYGFL